METTDVRAGELLERRRREVDVAGRASGVCVRNGDGDGLAVRASDDHLATAHRVPSERASE